MLILHHRRTLIDGGRLHHCAIGHRRHVHRNNLFSGRVRQIWRGDQHGANKSGNRPLYEQHTKQGGR